MNEAKQKADELVDKFISYAESSPCLIYHATQCALIAVNEVLKACPSEPSKPHRVYVQVEEAPRFWQAVKEELESRL